MVSRRWIGRWPVYSQLAGSDPLGRGRAAKSRKTAQLRPRTAAADKFVKSVCPYCAVGCGQNVYVQDGRVTQILVSEGIVRSAAGINQIKICGNGQGGYGDHETAHNVADVSLSPGHAAGPVRRRSFPTSSACGVCGKTAISELAVRSSYDLSADKALVAPAALARMPSLLRDAQQVFGKTGGLHAAGLFTSSGELLALREDVGRHNAVDKVVGWALREELLPLTGRVLLVSGRASFELTQKCLLAGIPVLAAVSAPSSLAARLAQES